MSLHLFKLRNYLPKGPYRTFQEINAIQYRRHHILQGNSLPQNLLQKCIPQQRLHARFASTDALPRIYDQIGESHIVHIVQQKLIDLHDAFGLPWWVMIVYTTLALRTCVVLPLSIHQHYVSAKFEMVLYDLHSKHNQQIGLEVKKLAAENNWDEKRIKKEFDHLLFEKKVELVQQYNCHPLKNVVLMLIQAPIWVVMSCVIRNLTHMRPVADATAQRVHAEMETESFISISNLTTMDDTWILPILMGVANMLNMHMNVRSRVYVSNEVLRSFIICGMTCFTGYMVVVAMTVPTSVALYWTTSAMIGFTQSWILLTPHLRDVLKIPTPITMRKDPQLYMLNRIKSFYRFLKY